MKPFGQGYKSMSPAISFLEQLIFEEKLRHSNNPVLNWNMSGLKVVFDPSRNRKFEKKHSNARIDGSVALTMAVGGLFDVAPPQAAELPRGRGSDHFMNEGDGRGEM